MDPRTLSSNELARLCAESPLPEHWCELLERLWRPVLLSVQRTARTRGCTDRSRTDELAQEVFLRLCMEDRRLLRQFLPQGEDSIIGYVKVVACNVTHDLLRAEKRNKRGGLLKQAEDDPEFLSSGAGYFGQAQAMERNVQIREIDEALTAHVPVPLSERDRTIYGLYFKQGLSAREIGGIAALGLTVKGVESSIHRTTTLLRSLLGARTQHATERTSVTLGVHAEEG